MSFGFTPKYEIEYDISTIANARFYVHALAVLKSLKWEVNSLSENSIVAVSRASIASWGEEIFFSITENKVKITSYCIGFQLLDFGKNKKNIHLFLKNFEKISAKQSDTEINEAYEVIASEFDKKSEDSEISYEINPTHSKQKINNFAAIFIIKKDFFITPILIFLNVIIFMMMAIKDVTFFNFSHDTLVAWGANFRPYTLDGEWWRLLTSCFVHLNFLHLFFNMYLLLFIGVLLEPILGRARFLTIYIITGFLASLSSLWWNNLTVSMGASGAIFGIIGVFFALLTTRLLKGKSKKRLLINLSIFLIYNFFNSLREGSNVDNAAHVGGLISGLIAGYAFLPSLIDKFDKSIKYFTISSFILVVYISSYFIMSSIDMTVINSMPQSFLPQDYQKDIKRFFVLDNMANEFFQKSDYSTKAELIKELKTRSIYYTKENLRIISNYDIYELPNNVVEKNNILKEYSLLKLKNFYLINKILVTGSNKNLKEVQLNNIKIQRLVNEFKSN